MKIGLIGQYENGFYGSMYECVKHGLKANFCDVVDIDRKNIELKQVDYYVIIDCSEDISGNLPEKFNAPVVYWSLDAHMPGGMDRTLKILEKCEMGFSSNLEHGLYMIKQFTSKPIHLLPITYNDSLAKGFNNTSKYEVSMIGHANSMERIRLWQLLDSKFNAKVGKMDTKEEFIDAHNSIVIVNQPTEPWDIILNNRFFEAMAYGGLLLQKKLKTSLIERLGFEEGRDFVYWYDFTDLLDKIDYYVTNVKDTKRIAQSGHERVLTYSMANQCHILINYLLNL